MNNLQVNASVALSEGMSVSWIWESHTVLYANQPPVNHYLAARETIVNSFPMV